MDHRNQEVTAYILQFEGAKKERIEAIRNLLHEKVPELKEKLWTKVPCFYIDKTSIVIRVFQDHMNLFADKILEYQEQLQGYTITPKGVLQIYDNQELPEEVLGEIFVSTFGME